MGINNMRLYHIHRLNNNDNIWQRDTKIKIDNSFTPVFYKKLQSEEQILIDRYGDYDIDYFISIMGELKFKNQIEEELMPSFLHFLNSLYFLRREQALEEGRKLYNPEAPSRLHSIFLTDESSLTYWIKVIGAKAYEKFLVNAEGNIFLSSDTFFPDETLFLDRQIEKSKSYWQPELKKVKSRKEYLFQGNLTIL